MFTANRITIATVGVRCQETDFPQIGKLPSADSARKHPGKGPPPKFTKKPTI
jgi:hypothetical protein